MADERQSEPVLVESHDGWATVVLNRPHRKNAMTGPMLDALASTIDRLGNDDSVAAIVIRGADGAFCSGVDLTELQHDPPHDWAATFHLSVQAAHRALYRAGCPIIVALERYGINGGSGLALAGDVIVGGEGAFLQIGEIRQGSGMPMNAAWVLLRTNESVLSRLAFLGDRVPAAELHALGLVTEVVPDDRVLARAEALAAEIAGHPAGASRTVKAEIRRRSGIDPDAWFSSTGNLALLSAEQVRD